MVNYPKRKLEKLAKKHDLKFVILHGSFATEKHNAQSDLDIAVLGCTDRILKTLLELYGDMADVFGDSSRRELDLKTLHRVDPLFRYHVVRDGILLFGNPTEYEEYKSFAYRAYVDSRDLRELEKILVEKFQRRLNNLASRYA